MSDWNPENYLLFKKQRTQPAIDLVNRVRDYRPASIVDIGCGPGNSTVVLKQVFPDVQIHGIDSSENMINMAAKQHGDITFSICSAQELTGTYDMLFSNACLQWIPGHNTLIPYLMERLTDKGVLAVQMPMNLNEPLYLIIKEIAADSKWNFENVYFERNDMLSPEEYFDILSSCSSNFEIWETVYYHALNSHEDLIHWVRETRLRPYLEVLDDEQKISFENMILEKAQTAYTPAANGDVVLKFRRLFFIAHK
jgi:trans-aconitate 2-methyltransferase